MSDHTPTAETAKSCFLDGAQGEFLDEDWDRFIASVKAEALREAASTCSEAFLRDAHGSLAREVADLIEATLLNVATTIENGANDDR